MQRVPKTSRSAFTIIELLVCIAVIGILMALLLPAVQMARESARRVQCQNNLKQLSLAVIQHEDTFNVYPSNGWGYQWMGDPDRGSGIKQPGGWIYQILPFIERADMHNIGAGLPDPLKRLELAELSSMTLSAVRCPTRPAPAACPRDPVIVWRNAELASHFSRTDYVANAGDRLLRTPVEGPQSLAEGDDPSYAWPDSTAASGIVFQRSEIRPRDITDGMSNTYLLGEKFVDPTFYTIYGDEGYDQPFAVGADWDLVRWTEKPPLQDRNTAYDPQRFGSAHTGGFQAALCDGSVRAISYTVDGNVHRHLGNRHDAAVVTLP